MSTVIYRRFNFFLKSSRGLFFVLLSLALLLAIVFSMTTGSVSIAWSDMILMLFRSNIAENQLVHNVFFDIRLPRVLFSSLNGAALAVAGVTMQALFRNPLAEPGLIGITSGASLGAISAIVLLAGNFFLISGSAFIGGLIATWVAYLIGRKFPGVAGLLLAGIAINTIASSLMGLMIYMADDKQLRDLTFWTMGSLAGASWSILSWLAPLSMGLMIYLCSQWRVMNALLLGQREASHLGFQLNTIKKRLILVTALLVGPLVATTGGIGFIGLVIPHIMRLFLGAYHRHLLPASMIAGAIILTLADCLARVLISPAELPIGLITSLIGGPFFLWMISHSKQRI